jgi:hypothetical protein
LYLSPASFIRRISSIIFFARVNLKKYYHKQFAHTTHMSVAHFLLLHVFTALLPPVEGTGGPADEDYYQILGVPRNAKQEDVRQAYRAKSLAFHPDKIAQRRGRPSQRNITSADDEAAQTYERVQEAYSVLHDLEKRKQYAQWGYSPARYRFVTTGGIHHPVALYENLTRATCMDKTRLVVLVSFFLITMVLLQPVLMAAKVNALHDDTAPLHTTTWRLILVPFWIFMSLDLLLWLGLSIVAKHVRSQMTLTFCEHACWLVGVVLLTRHWDDPQDSVNWHKVSIPFYVAIAFRIMSTLDFLHYLQREQQKMASPHFVEQQEGRLDEMDDGEREKIAEKYTIVTPDDEVVVNTLESLRSQGQNVTEQECETIRVQSSPEYAASVEARFAMMRPCRNLVVYGTMMTALIASKLQGQLDGSWWVIFIPMWIWLGSKILRSLVVCCCVISTEQPPDGEEEHDNDDEQGDTNEDVNATPAENTENGKTPTKRPDLVASSQPSESRWASPVGDMKEFNSPVNEDAPFRRGEVQPPTQTSQSSNKKAASASGTAASQDDNDEEAGGDSSSVDPGIDFDEEAFRAWQSAHAKAREDASEQHGRAQGDCMTASVQLIILCLMVAKLEAEVDNDENDDDGFNAFWILFLPFLLTGCALCCCSFLIYGAGAATGLDDLVERAKHKTDEETTPATEASPIIIPSSEGVVTTTTTTTTSTIVMTDTTSHVNKAVDASSKVSHPSHNSASHEANDMNDLD